MSFCGLIKGISREICILCVRVKISKRSFEPFLCLDLIKGIPGEFCSSEVRESELTQFSFGSFDQLKVKTCNPLDFTDNCK